MARIYLDSLSQSSPALPAAGLTRRRMLRAVLGAGFGLATLELLAACSAPRRSTDHGSGTNNRTGRNDSAGPHHSASAHDGTGSDHRTGSHDCTSRDGGAGPHHRGRGGWCTQERRHVDARYVPDDHDAGPRQARPAE